MNIDWSQFSFYSALVGGSLIGIAASLLIMLNGRVMGISGILGGLHQAKSGWRYAFIAGLLCAPMLYYFAYGTPAVQIEASHTQLLLAGFLVGIGTRYGSGCTSGHGICGIARLSKRSLLATACFMLSGFITVYVMRHL